MLVFSLPLAVSAEEQAPPAASVPARAPRLVGVILSSAQALLWDEDLGEYVIHKVGEPALGGRLVELDSDHVVVERGEAREVIAISAPPQLRVAGRRQPKRMPAMIISAAPEVAEKTVAATVPASAAPMGAGSEGGTSAPPAAAASAATPSTRATPSASAPPSVSPAPVLAAPAAAAAPAPAAPASTAPSVSVAPVVVAPPVPVASPVIAPAPSSPATLPVAGGVIPSSTTTDPVAAQDSADQRPVTTTVLIPRAELDRELGDFAALSQDVQVATHPNGGFRLAQLRAGSFFERIGLRTNDVVLRVDGRPINGVEDASAAYAWLRVTSRFTVDVVRDGHPLTLRYVIAPAQPMTASMK